MTKLKVQSAGFIERQSPCSHVIVAMATSEQEPFSPSTAINVTRVEKKKSATTTAAKKNNKKKNPNEESCGVVELVQSMLVLTRMYKLIIGMVRDARTITA